MRMNALFLICLTFLNGCAVAGKGNNMAAKRERMVQIQIEDRGVAHAGVLKVMREIPRHEFVPREHQNQSYEDHPLPIGFNQTISQPYIVGLMTELLDPQPTDKVLEIGTGSGYQAAVLASLVKEVFTIEILPTLAASAKELLSSKGFHNIQVRAGDGYLGWPEEAPFDKIIVTAAPPELPETLIDQLKTGGVIVVPVGTYYQELLVIRKTPEGIKEQLSIPVRFVPMVRGD
jgi:protein-L-isoaspartate(D-aspartate) O-methyltransferase